LLILQTEAEEKKLREASLAASSRLKRALLKEKEAKDSQQKALNEIQARGILVRVSLKSKTRSVSAPKCQFSPAGLSLIQPLLESLEHVLNQNGSIKRLFQPTLRSIFNRWVQISPSLLDRIGHD